MRKLFQMVAYINRLLQINIKHKYIKNSKTGKNMVIIMRKIIIYMRNACGAICRGDFNRPFFEVRANKFAPTDFAINYYP